LAAQGAQTEGVMPLGQAVPLVVGEQGAVEKGGWSPAEGAIEQQLPRGGKEEIGAADDFGDLHFMVIDHHGELVGGEIVVTPHDEIAEVCAGRELLVSEVSVDEADGFTVGNTKTPTDGRGVTGWLRVEVRRRVACRTAWRRWAAGAGIEGFLVGGVRGAQRLEDVAA